MTQNVTTFLLHLDILTEMTENKEYSQLKRQVLCELHTPRFRLEKNHMTAPNLLKTSKTSRDKTIFSTFARQEADNCKFGMVENQENMM